MFALWTFRRVFFLIPAEVKSHMLSSSSGWTMILIFNMLVIIGCWSRAFWWCACLTGRRSDLPLWRRQLFRGYGRFIECVVNFPVLHCPVHASDILNDFVDVLVAMLSKRKIDREFVTVRFWENLNFKNLNFSYE